jgi:ferredoxin-fold anticodon binding domain-containing protein
MFAGTTSWGFRVVVGILIEGNGVDGMFIAEDVSAASAVVATVEIVEVLGTSSFVADLGVGIRLCGYNVSECNVIINENLLAICRVGKCCVKNCNTRLTRSHLMDTRA